MIALTDLTLSFPGRTLLAGATAELPAGSLTALIGRNGTGKSTLLRAISGGRPVQGGTIALGGKPLPGMRPAELARTLSMVATERVRVANMLVEDVIGLGRAPYTDWIGRLSGSDKVAVAGALALTGMAGYARRPIDSLSDGECQRAMIARALAQQTPIMLLDEPTSFLDLPGRHELVRLLQGLARRQDKCILFSTHELDIALRYCDRIALLHDGQLTLRTPAELRRSGDLASIFGASNIQ